MSTPVELGPQGEPESVVSSAFGRMGELYVPMRIIEERRDGTGRRGGLLADGKGYLVDKFLAHDYVDIGPEIVSFGVGFYNDESLILKFVLNSNGLKSLYMPGARMRVGNSYVSGMGLSFDINSFSNTIPQVSLQEFRGLSVPFVERFSENLTAKTSDKVEPILVTFFPDAGVTGRGEIKTGLLRRSFSQ